jgi:DNA ligase (NAD+)
VLEVRGEVYMRRDDFEKLNEQQREKIAQGREEREDLRQPAQCRGRRRAAARPGIARQRPLSFFAYGWGEVTPPEQGGPRFETHYEACSRCAPGASRSPAARNSPRAPMI